MWDGFGGWVVSGVVVRGGMLTVCVRYMCMIEYVLFGGVCGLVLVLLGLYYCLIFSFGRVFGVVNGFCVL